MNLWVLRTLGSTHKNIIYKLLIEIKHFCQKTVSPIIIVFAERAFGIIEIMLFAAVRALLLR